MAGILWPILAGVMALSYFGPVRAADAVVKARPLPLSSVRLTGGPLKRAQDLDARYLLALEPDRMMAYLRKEAGLAPKAEGYGGWDGPGRQLTGHIAGHYLSAVSLMWAATGDTRFRDRAAYLVKELKEVQDRHGDGYIGALRDRDGISGKIRFEELSKGAIRSSGFDLNGLWSPWYVQHKIFAGLRDAYRLMGDRTALEVETSFAAWAEKILAPLGDEQIQQMLNTEFGGMNEIAADLYADTGDKRWFALSDKFYHREIVDPLARGNDILEGKHGNTLVPKLLGHLARYIYTGAEVDRDAARFFWGRVAGHHSFATGGHGKNEYFGRADRLNAMVSGRTAETCNVYNMIKMSRALFSIEPAVRYADFHERALFNHVLGSMDPQDGRTCYMVPVGLGVQHEYQDMARDFTCCVGSGMESHALHGYGIYFDSGDKLWVNLYAPSTAQWTAGVTVDMRTTFPEGQHASLKITTDRPRSFTLALRRPYWAGAQFRVRVNGRVATTPSRSGYVEVARTWTDGDTVDVDLPKTVRVEPLPDNPRRISLMWGPLVLAGDLGPEQARSEEDPPAPAPEGAVFLSAGQALDQWFKPSPEKPGAFRAQTAAHREVEFVPFYQLHRRLYGIYWDLYTPAEWRKETEARAALAEQQRRLERDTVALVQPGQIQPGGEFNLQAVDSTTDRVQGRYGRRATKGFSLDLPVEAERASALVVTYSNDERQKRTFVVIVEGRQLGAETIERRSPEQDVRFYDVVYRLAPELISGKPKVTVRFEGTEGNSTGAVFAVRTVRENHGRPTP